MVHWFSHEISPGEEWQNIVSDRLESAEVILLLVSSSFLNSEFCYGTEVKRAMQRHRAGKAIVIPVILRQCLWNIAPFGELQALPEGAKPITMWSNQDEALTNVVRKVHELAKVLRQRAANKGSATK